MADIDLDQLIASRAEARGDDGRTVAFRFKGAEWRFRDPLMLNDDEKDDLTKLDFDPDIACWYMGAVLNADGMLEGGEEFDKFVEAGGNSSIFFLAFRQHMKDQQAEVQGNPTQPNRSSRRMASKKSKQH